MGHPRVSKFWGRGKLCAKISWTAWIFKFCSLQFIVTIKRWSNLIRSLPLGIFSSIRCRPEQGSSSTLSSTYKNAFCHNRFHFRKLVLVSVRFTFLKGSTNLNSWSKIWLYDPGQYYWDPWHLKHENIVSFTKLFISTNASCLSVDFP